MIKFLRTDNHMIHEINELEDGAWIMMQSPTEQEAKFIAERLHVDFQDIMAAIDPEEKTRIDIKDDYTLIISDIPEPEVRHRAATYKTVPLGIIFNHTNIVTVCSQETVLFNYFQESKLKEFSTKKKLKFVYQIMLHTSMLYQQALTNIDNKRIEFEEHIGSLKTESDLVKIHELESTLVYFITSLRGNNNVLHKLTRSEFLSNYPEDQALLADVTIENQQAIEMAQIYREILDSTRELITVLINLRMNEIMKRLTSITLIFSIPMIISGMYGMNVDPNWVPLAQAAHGFGLVGLITALICLIMGLVLKKKKMM